MSSYLKCRLPRNPSSTCPQRQIRIAKSALISFWKLSSYFIYISYTKLVTMSVYPYLVGAFLTARIAQRVYYLWNGHECFFASFLFHNKLLKQKGQKSVENSFSSHVESLFRRPRERLSRFFADNNIQVTSHSIHSSVDRTTFRYKRLGTGKKMILLANGVGTDLYMWLPVLQYLCSYRSNFFEDYTVIASTYRGLFGESDDAECSAGKKHQDIEVTIDNLVEDVMDIKKHAGNAKRQCC